MRTGDVSRPLVGCIERSLSSIMSHRVPCWVGVLLEAAQPWRHPPAPIRKAIRMGKARPGLAVMTPNTKPLQQAAPGLHSPAPPPWGQPYLLPPQGTGPPRRSRTVFLGLWAAGLSNLGGSHRPQAGPEPPGKAWGEVGSRQPTFLHPHQCFNLRGSSQLSFSLGGCRLPAPTPPAPGASGEGL